MKQAIVLFIVAFCAASGCAATSRFQDVDSIKINKNFMCELEAALVEKRDAMVVAVKETL